MFGKKKKICRLKSLGKQVQANGPARILGELLRIEAGIRVTEVLVDVVELDDDTLYGW